nr:hypothetical protein [Tanacetum cinerariifolium]
MEDINRGPYSKKPPIHLLDPVLCFKARWVSERPRKPTVEYWVGPEPDLPIPVLESFHEQTDEELTENDVKRMDADDQANKTILLGLPEDVYATVDSCKKAKEVWERVRQMMKGLDIGEQEKKAKLFNEWEKVASTDWESIESYYHRFMKLMNDLKRNKHFPENIAANLKFLNNLQPEWKRHITIVRQTKNLPETNFTQIYDFLKMNQDENSMQPLMTSLEDINDPTEAINASLILFAKAFQLTVPTNNNQRTSSNPRNRQIAQPVMNSEWVLTGFIAMDPYPVRWSSLLILSNSMHSSRCPKYDRLRLDCHPQGPLRARTPNATAPTQLRLVSFNER